MTLNGTICQVVLQYQLFWMKMSHIQPLILQQCMSLCHYLGLLQHKARVSCAQFILRLLHKAARTAPGRHSYTVRFMEELGEPPELSLGNTLGVQNQKQEKSGALGRKVDNKAPSSNELELQQWHISRSWFGFMIEMEVPSVISLALWKSPTSMQFSGCCKLSTADLKSAVCSYVETSFITSESNRTICKEALTWGLGGHTWSSLHTRKIKIWTANMQWSLKCENNTEKVQYAINHKSNTASILGSIYNMMPELIQ